MIFSLDRIPAKTSANAKVTIVTTTISKIMFCIDLIKLVSDINVLKFFRPTNASFGEYAPFSNNDIRNTFKVGNIINTKNKITAGAMHTAKKPLRPLAFFILSHSFQTNRTI